MIDFPYFQVCTANVQGLARKPAKLSPYYDFIHHTPSCVYVLTETNLDSTSPALLHNPPPSHISLFTTRAENKTVGSGVTLLFNSSLQFSTHPSVLIPGYLIYACICVGRYRVHIYALYSPPTNTPGNKALATHIHNTVHTHASRHASAHDPTHKLIILGDINVALRPLDKGNARRFTAHRTWPTIARRPCTYTRHPRTKSISPQPLTQP